MHRLLPSWRFPSPSKPPLEGLVLKKVPNPLHLRSLSRADSARVKRVVDSSSYPARFPGCMAFISAIRRAVTAVQVRATQDVEGAPEGRVRSRVGGGDQLLLGVSTRRMEKLVELFGIACPGPDPIARHALMPRASVLLGPVWGRLTSLCALHPAETERMTSRICVDLEIVGRLRTCCRLEQLRACGHDFGVSFLEVVDPQIEVDLLRSSLRPLGRYVVGRELDPHFRLAVHKHHVPVVLGIHRAT